jgi:hypothetical protein
MGVTQAVSRTPIYSCSTIPSHEALRQLQDGHPRPDAAVAQMPQLRQGVLRKVRRQDNRLKHALRQLQVRQDGDKKHNVRIPDSHWI